MTGHVDAVTLDVVILGVLTGWPLVVFAFWLAAAVIGALDARCVREGRDGAS